MFDHPPSLLCTTERLDVRPFNVRDYSAWRAAYRRLKPPQSPHDESQLPADKRTYNAFRARVKRNRLLAENDKAYIFGVFDRASGHLVGTTNLIIVFRLDLQTAFIGYEIFNNHWRQGYGRECVEATLKCAFGELKLHRVEAGIEPENAPSIALVESLGMRREGLQERYCYSSGAWRDLISFAMTAEELGYPEQAPSVRAAFCLDNL